MSARTTITPAPPAPQLHRQAALSMVPQVFLERDPQECTKWLRFAEDCVDELDAGASESEWLSAQLRAQACIEEADLLKEQEEPEAKSVSKHWLDGPLMLCGPSLVVTLAHCRRKIALVFDPFKQNYFQPNFHSLAKKITLL